MSDMDRIEHIRRRRDELRGDVSENIDDARIVVEAIQVLKGGV